MVTSLSDEHITFIFRLEVLKLYELNNSALFLKAQTTGQGNTETVRTTKQYSGSCTSARTGKNRDPEDGGNKFL
jgi:hypothetical protein